MNRDCDRCGLGYPRHQLHRSRVGKIYLWVCDECQDKAPAIRTIAISQCFVKTPYIPYPYDKVVLDTDPRVYYAVTSGLYPVIVTDTLSASFGAGNSVLWSVPEFTDTVAATFSVGGGTLIFAGPTTHTVYDIDTVAATFSVGNGTLAVTLTQHTVYDIDTVAATFSVGNGTLAVTLTQHTVYDIDTVAATFSVGNGTLV